MNEFKLMGYYTDIFKPSTDLPDGPDPELCSHKLLIDLVFTGKNYSKFFLFCELKDNPYTSWRTISLLVQHDFVIRHADCLFTLSEMIGRNTEVHFPPSIHSSASICSKIKNVGFSLVKQKLLTLLTF